MIIVVGLFVSNGIVSASEASSEVDFNIQPILPTNQIDRGNSFFDLQVKAGDTQTIKVQINNFSKEEQKFSIKINRAETNGNVIIDYSGTTTEKRLSDKENIEKWVKYPESVTIPGEKAGIVSIEVSVPKEKFDGIILGGIQISRDISKEKKSGLSTDYDYILGLMLTENDKKIEPDLKLLKVSPKVISNNAGLNVTMQNPQPINISKVQMVGHIYKEDDQEKPVITREIKEGGIAPSSTFDINFFNGAVGETKPLDPGDYLLKLDFKDESGKEWHFEKKFTISKKEAEVVNTQVFTVKKDNTLLYVIIGILTAVLLILIFFFIFFFLKRKKEKEDQE